MSPNVLEVLVVRVAMLLRVVDIITLLQKSQKLSEYVRLRGCNDRVGLIKSFRFCQI